MGACAAECYLQMSWLDGVTEVREKEDTGAVVGGGLLPACNDTPSVRVDEEATGARHTVSLWMVVGGKSNVCCFLLL